MFTIGKFEKVVVMSLLPMIKVCIPSFGQRMTVKKHLNVVKLLVQTIWVESFYLLIKVFHRCSKSNSYLMSISRRGSVNLSTPIFGNINLTEKFIFCDKFIFCLETQSKIAEIISICTLNHWGLVPTVVLTRLYLGFKLQFKFKLQWKRVCFKLNIYKLDLKPKKVKPISKFFEIVV